MTAWQFPNFDPIAFTLFGIAVRWYALAYLAGFVIGWQLCMRMVRGRSQPPYPQHYDDFLTWAVVGVVLGGRLGYVFIYNTTYYLQHPAEIFVTWHGGMSFHGGIAGVLLAAWLYSRKIKVEFWRFLDPVAAVAPIGLFLGRLANFVNGELYGRVTDVPWAMVFPYSDGQPRHPSQLYQAGMEGILLFLLLAFVVRRYDWREKPGLLSGLFLAGYGVARIIGELFREPDRQLGYFLGGVTMGQILSLPMVLFGLWLMRKANDKPAL
ncbi:MAG: prolipoprotein diacylglyceryl transferase [Alphaproteobacteria bacterium]|nr:prolipoprotein diacylglyceryl transferase [Alphaproteobacteria bacterium]